jgi:hypothetical protein
VSNSCRISLLVMASVDVAEPAGWTSLVQIPARALRFFSSPTECSSWFVNTPHFFSEVLFSFLGPDILHGFTHSLEDKFWIGPSNRPRLLISTPSPRILRYLTFEACS